MTDIIPRDGLRPVSDEFSSDVEEEQRNFLEIEGVEILGYREGGLIDCYVPVELIDNEEVPVGEDYVKQLADNMRKLADKNGGTGQNVPILLGLIEGENKLKIVDGFHRSAALKELGETKVYATVKVTDWDGLYDERIFTAKDHKHVRFSRVVQWIREIWHHNELSEYLSVEQAVLLFRFDSDGSKLGLSPEHVEAAKAWVARKEQQWGMQSMTIHSHLKVAEHVDPRLVHSTREKKSGKALDAPTQSMIKIFSDMLPDKFDLQNLVAEVAMERNLQGPYIKAVCNVVSGYENVEAARALIEGIDWDTWEPHFGDSKGRALRRAHDARYNGKKALKDARVAIERSLGRALQTIERDEPVTAEMRDRLVEALGEAAELAKLLGRLGMQYHTILQAEGTAIKPPSAATPARRIARSQRPNGVAELESRGQTPGAIRWREQQAGKLAPGQEVQDGELGTSVDPERAVRSVFSNEIEEYLNGERDTLPAIRERWKIGVVETRLASGRGCVHPERMEELREELVVAQSSRDFTKRFGR